MRKRTISEIFPLQTVNQLQRDKWWLYSGKTGWTLWPGDRGLHPKWFDVTCSTSPWREALEEQWVCHISGCPAQKALIKRKYQIDLGLWFAYKIKVLYSWKTVEHLTGREELRMLKETECPDIAGVVDKVWMGSIDWR